MVEVKRGAVAVSLAGHDKGDFQIILDHDRTYAMVCDGKHRPLEKVKKKKLIHLKVTNTIVSEENLKSNKSIKKCLGPFIKAADRKNLFTKGAEL
ncbi:MAG: KOW domain-containing RNA-binding protein [Oscillospiraceae bacterium]|jgi:ribosomal protein L14E/L6E/L27E|nr:KOW domain-containing RNA-binding protein [Oscillospiraceae bacterium]